LSFEVDKTRHLDASGTKLACFTDFVDDSRYAAVTGIHVQAVAVCAICTTISCPIIVTHLCSASHWQRDTGSCCWAPVVQLLIDISCLLGPQQQTCSCSSGIPAVGPCWDRQMDTAPLHRYGSAYYACSANKSVRDRIQKPASIGQLWAKLKL